MSNWQNHDDNHKNFDGPCSSLWVEARPCVWSWRRHLAARIDPRQGGQSRQLQWCEAACGQQTQSKASRIQSRDSRTQKDSTRLASSERLALPERRCGQGARTRIPSWQLEIESRRASKATGRARGHSDEMNSLDFLFEMLSSAVCNSRIWTRNCKIDCGSAQADDWEWVSGQVYVVNDAHPSH